jgi:dihydropteroate synthase
LIRATRRNSICALKRALREFLVLEPIQIMLTLPLRQHYRVQIRDKFLDLGERTQIMGILNVTPDSFSDGGHFFKTEDAIAHAWEIAEEGADILDVGAESSRPGSAGISLEEELARVVPVLEALAGSYPIPISIDTSKAEVADAAMVLGAAIINDITALQDFRMGEVAARYRAGLIMMHMRGNPQRMQELPMSPDIIGELEEWAGLAAARAAQNGLSRDQLILDPGIGFGKSAAQNLEIIRNLNRLALTGFPLLLGTSRKSFIGKVVKTPVHDRVWGTSATVAASIIFGAHIVRVHDVAAMRQVALMTDAILGGGELE